MNPLDLSIHLRYFRPGASRTMQLPDQDGGWWLSAAQNEGYDTVVKDRHLSGDEAVALAEATGSKELVEAVVATNRNAKAAELAHRARLEKQIADAQAALARLDSRSQKPDSSPCVSTET